jgi:integrase
VKPRRKPQSQGVRIMVNKSIVKRPTRPRKPRRDFPLFAHANGQWAKKIRRVTHYFGKWADPDRAVEKYRAQRDDLEAGRVPRQGGDAFELRDMLNHYLTGKQRQRDAGELQPKTFAEYLATCERIAETFGAGRPVDDLRPTDFGQLRQRLTKLRGPVALGNEIQRVRSVFKWGYDAGLLDKPMRFGPEFRKPSAKRVREARHAKGERMIEPDDLRAMLNAASSQMRAMMLLGLNCGFGGGDCAALPISSLDLKKGIVSFPRPKTAIPRRAVLWPETITALRGALAARPKPKNKVDTALVFTTRCGNRWIRYNDEGVSCDAVGFEFAKLMKRCGVTCAGRFYTLRHVFRTIADETRDHPAIDRVMGHEDGSMATRYRERIGDDRLRAVTDHVRVWLFEREKQEE